MNKYTPTYIHVRYKSWREASMASSIPAVCRGVPPLNAELALVCRHPAGAHVPWSWSHPLFVCSHIRWSCDALRSAAVWGPVVSAFGLNYFKSASCYSSHIRQVSPRYRYIVRHEANPNILRVYGVEDVAIVVSTIQ